MGEMRSQFERVKSERGEADQASNRLELLGRRSQATHTPDNPYAYNAAPSSSSSQAFAPHAAMQDHLLHENSFLQNTNQQLDQYLDAGRNVLDSLKDQRALLKGTQRRLYS